MRGNAIGGVPEPDASAPSGRLDVCLMVASTPVQARLVLTWESRQQQIASWQNHAVAT